MKFEWEGIYSSYQAPTGGCNTHRAKVIGGWVVSSDIYTDPQASSSSRSISQAMVFIPDPSHEWKIDA